MTTTASTYPLKKEIENEMLKKLPTVTKRNSWVWIQDVIDRITEASPAAV